MTSIQRYAIQIVADVVSLTNRMNDGSSREEESTDTGKTQFGENIDWHDVRARLLSGTHHILELSDWRMKQHVYAALSEPDRSIFKDINSQFADKHKFKGKT